MNSDVVEVESLRRENASLKETNARLKKLYDQVALELALLKKKIFGKKAEKIPARTVGQQLSGIAFDRVVEVYERTHAGAPSTSARPRRSQLETLQSAHGHPHTAAP